MDEQQTRFLAAVHAAQGEAQRAGVLDIAARLGLDVINSKADRDLYQEITLELRDAGYLECLANNYGVTCGIVRLTPSGLSYLEP